MTGKQCLCSARNNGTEREFMIDLLMAKVMYMLAKPKKDKNREALRTGSLVWDRVVHLCAV